MNLKPSRASAHRRSTPPDDRDRQGHPEVPDQGRPRWPHGEVRYQFTFAEHLTAETRDDFPELATAATVAGYWGTVLFGLVTDRAHLYGLLHRCNVQGLTVVEVRMLPD